MDLLAVWEKGRGLPAQGRALLLAEAAMPGASREQVAALPVGKRDLAITELRRATVGESVRGRAGCPACRQVVEAGFELDAIDVEAGSSGMHELPDGTRFRLPDTLDLDAAYRAATLSEARRILADRCVGEGVAVETVALAAARMAELDGRADLSLELECPACGHRWDVAFDIAQFFWQEIGVVARRLLLEVHELALAYGWPESEILAMSAARRQAYLEMVRA